MQTKFKFAPIDFSLDKARQWWHYQVEQEEAAEDLHWAYWRLIYKKD